MQIVSGIATASGVSSLLNAPRDAGTDIRASVGESARAETVRRRDAEERLDSRRESARPVNGPDKLDRPEPAPERLPAATPEEADSRRERFTEAVGALRRGESDDPKPLTESRIREALAEAADVREAARGPDANAQARFDDRLKAEERAQARRDETLEAAARSREAAAERERAERSADRAADLAAKAEAPPRPELALERPAERADTSADDVRPTTENRAATIVSEPRVERTGPPREGTLAATFFDDGLPAPIEPLPDEAEGTASVAPLADDGIPKELEPLFNPADQASAAPESITEDREAELA